MIKAKNEAWQKTGEETEKSMENIRANRAWKVLKSIKAQNKDLIGMQEWVRHYQGLLTEDRAAVIANPPKFGT